ncbi:MAG: exopolysaccharide biosynthesis protein [Pseudomonadota bacterium]
MEIETAVIDPLNRPDTIMQDMIGTVLEDTPDGEIRLGEVVGRFGRRSFQPLLVVFGLCLASPLSGIPFLSSILGLCITLVAMQGALGRPSIWLPHWLLTRHVERGRVTRALARMEGVAAWLDTITTPRLTVLTGDIGGRCLMGLAAGAGLVIPFMEVVPFTSSVMGAGVALLAFALLTRDGIVALAGVGTICAAALLPIGLFTQVVTG